MLSWVVKLIHWMKCKKMRILACKSLGDPSQMSRTTLQDQRRVNKKVPPCSIIPMNIVTGLILDNQSLAANECTIMYTHLKIHATSFGALWPIS